MSPDFLSLSDGAFVRFERGLGGTLRLKFCRPGIRRGAERVTLDDEPLVVAFAEAIDALIVSAPLARGEQRTETLDSGHVIIARSTGDAKTATLCIVTFIDGDDDQAFTITGRADLLRLVEFVAAHLSTRTAPR